MHYDAVVIGSGFGGSVAALRLAEKGYRVLVLEKGRRFQAEDFPKTNRELKRWLWAPSMGWRGLFKMTFLPHVTALSGVGVGGGSLVYANTLPYPPDSFFSSQSWATLADWKSELQPHYETARRMLGATLNQLPGDADRAVESMARRLGLSDKYHMNPVGVYFGEPGVSNPDPYFEGKGPERAGCIGCGGCMLGCRHNAKNSLDKNYLYLAERLGVEIQADTEVTWVSPSGVGGYRVRTDRGEFQTQKVFFCGGVMGTVPLLLKLKESAGGLPALSNQLGNFVRTNSESLIGVISNREDLDFSKGVAIGSILQTDEHSHLEPVRYSAGSDFFRFLVGPHVGGDTSLQRLIELFRVVVGNPRAYARAVFKRDLASRTTTLLYMRTIDGYLRLKLGRNLWTGFQRGLTSEPGEGPRPTCHIPEATALAREFSREVDGFAQTLFTETLLGIPTTAHILGGCCLGRSADDGVVSKDHEVFGYPGLYVVDGASMSANPGVNPSLTITAMAERALSKVESKAGSQ